MARLQVDLDGEGAWPDLLRRPTIAGVWTRLAAHAERKEGEGLQVAIVVDLPDGRPVCAETSWARLYAAVEALEAR